MAPRVIAGILCLYILLLSGNPLSAGFLLFQTALSDSQSLETNGEKNERTTRKVIQSQLTIFY